MTSNTTEFIDRVKKIHEDKFNYSQVVYKNSQTKVIITCNTCGHTFEQTPNNHLRGKGCIKCAYKLKADSRRKSNEQVILDFQKIHTDENNKPTGLFITDKGNNLSGFSALPTGYIFFHGDYFDFDYISFFATSDWYQDDNCSDLFPIFRYISSGWGELGKSVDDTCGGGSVRCVKDS